MSRAVLLGVPDTRRTEYMQKAAACAGLPLFFWDWRDWQKQLRQAFDEPIRMKIDPPRWDSPYLSELDGLAGDYKQKLLCLAAAADTHPIRFLNHPSAIAALLDKASCKKTLAQAQLPVTELLTEAPLENIQQLFDAMQTHGVCQVFIKPKNGSGAAGVSAFRIQPRSGQMALYTCAAPHPQKGLSNTKRLRCFTDKEQIHSLLHELFKTECILERWYAKASYQGYSYDLRAVVQNGQIDCLLARLSKGPVTNLQLNNRPLAVSALSLPAFVQENIERLCQQAAALFPGLLSAGIDILLEKGSLTPRIIEMNGQGDLIYQDIFHENKIYRRQAELLKRMEEPTI